MKENPYLKYINLSDWILDHINQLDLDAQEVLVLLQLEYAIRTSSHVDPKILASQCNFSIKDFDRNLTSLIQKGYIKVNITEATVSYELQNIVQDQQIVNQKTESTDVLDLFEREFKRPLSSNEIHKLNDWLMKVDHGFLVHALREAVIYQKVNFNYIDRILVTWLNDKVKLEDLDAGIKRDR